jgi:hypothetical protein
MSNEWLTYIIANTVDPYGYELPLIVAYPPGFLYRARFKSEWVDDAVLGRLADLKGSPALVVYRHFESGCLYPVRFANVRAIARYGDVVYVEYELREIVAYHESPPRRDEQVGEFNRDWEAEHPEYASSNVAGGHMRPLVLRSKYWPKIDNPYLPSDHEAREFSSWSNLCELVAKLPIYTSMEFLRVIDLREERSDTVVAPYGRRYRLRSGLIYELRVAQQIFRASDTVRPHDVSFETDGHALKSLTRKRRAVGKYDVLSFRFRAIDSEGERMAGMLVVSGEMKKGEPLRLEILTESMPRWRVLSSTGAVVGAIAVFYPEAVGVLGVPGEWKHLVEKIGTLLFVVSLIDSKSIWQHLLRR